MSTREKNAEAALQRLAQLHAQTSDEPLRIERFTMGGVDYATSGDMGVHLQHRGLYAGESGTVLVALDIDGNPQSVVTVDDFHDPLGQLDRAAECVMAVRDRLASLLAMTAITDGGQVEQR